MKNYQRLILLALLISTLAVTQVFAKEGITQLKVNEEIIQIPKGLSVEEELIPLVWFAKTMGASSVSWDKGTITVEIDHFLDLHRYTNYQRGIKADSKTALSIPKRLEDLANDESAIIHEGTAYVPLRSVAEDLNMSVVYAPRLDTRTHIIMIQKCQFHQQTQLYVIIPMLLLMKIMMIRK